MLKAKFVADSLLYLLSHFECEGHTVHMLTQQCLPLPLTKTVKSSLFTHVHPVHSPWLPGSIDVTQTILVIVTMVVFFFSGQTFYIFIFYYILSFPET